MKNFIVGIVLILSAAVKVYFLNINLGLYGDNYLLQFLWQVLLQGGIYLSLYLIRFRKRVIVYWAGQTIYYFGILGYYTFYHRIFNPFLDFRVIGDGIEIFLQGVIPLSPAMFLLFLDLPALIIFVQVFKSPSKTKYVRSLSIFSTTFIIFLFTIFISSHPNPVIPLKGGALSWSLSKLIPQKESAIVEVFELERNIQKVENNKAVPFSGYLPDLNLSAKPNFLLIQFESLQSGLPEMMHNGQAVMPFVNKLVKESIYFPYCFAYHRKGGTSDCEIAIFDNIDPENKVLMRSTRYPHDESFVKLLNSSGYRNFAFHNYSEDFYNRSDSYRRLGFEDFYDYYDMKMGPPKWGAKDGEMFEYISQLTPPDFPFLSYIITITSHVGYSHINNYYENSLFDDVKRGRDRDALLCFNYTDVELEKFLTEVRNKYDNLFVFIYGDHATPTVEFNNELNPSLYSRGENVMEFVPLIVIPPKELEWDPQVHPEVLASFHDIGPTIIELAGLNTDDPEIGDGKNMWGGSLLSIELNKLPIPYDAIRLERSDLLAEIKKVVPLSFPQETTVQIKSVLSSSTSLSVSGGAISLPVSASR